MPVSVTTDTLLAFKAGRAYRRDGTNTVEAHPAKGAILLRTDGEDGFLHFVWQSRDTDEEEVRVWWLDVGGGADPGLCI